MNLVVLGMGGPIITQVLISLCERKDINKLLLIKPKINSSKNTFAKLIIDLLPNIFQSSLRFLKVTLFNKKHWSLPDAIYKFNIEVKYIGDINSAEAKTIIKEYSADFIIIANYNQILKEDIINLPKVITMNLHPSLLPEYRGANPIFWMFKNNEKTGGITLHKVDTGIDTGCIIKQRKIELTKSETVTSYIHKCGIRASIILRKILDNYIKTGEIPCMRQEHSSSYYFPKPKKSDAELIILDDFKSTYRNWKAMNNYFPVFINYMGNTFCIKKICLSKTKPIYFKSKNKIILESKNQYITLKV